MSPDRDAPIDRCELQTERLLLRPFRPGDAADVFAYASDPVWSRFLLLPIAGPYLLQDAEQFVSQAVSEAWDKNAQFAIVIEDKVVGAIALHFRPDLVASLGYSLSRTLWGQGITAEAAAAVLKWGFETCGLHKVFATAIAENLQSTRVMEKLGMRKEAHLRSHRLHRGVYVDEVWYGLLAEEWRAQRTLAQGTAAKPH